MPIQLNVPVDNGLGFLFSCDCEDMGFHGRWTMTQEQINSRWRKVLEMDAPETKDGIEYEIAGHTIFVSRGKGDPGPHWLCKHAMRVLKHKLYAEFGWLVTSLSAPDMPSTPDWVLSLDGWMKVWYVDTWRVKEEMSDRSGQDQDQS